MVRKKTKCKSAKTRAKTAVKGAAQKAARKAVKKVARTAVTKAKRSSAKRTSDTRRTRKIANTYETAISTLTHYIEKGGKNLSDAGKSTLEAARDVIHDVATKVSKATV
jgi:L-lactate utilization protein LutB